MARKGRPMSAASATKDIYRNGPRVWRGKKCLFRGCKLHHGHNGAHDRRDIEQAEFEPELVLAKRRVRGRIEYRIKWRHWPAADATWEKAAKVAWLDVVHAWVAQQQ